MSNTSEKDLWDRWEQAISAIYNDQDIINLDKGIFKLFEKQIPNRFINECSIDYNYPKDFNKKIDDLRKLREDRVKSILRIYGLEQIV